MDRYLFQEGSTEFHCVYCKIIDRLDRLPAPRNRKIIGKTKNKNNFSGKIFGKNSDGIFWNFEFAKNR